LPEDNQKRDGKTVKHCWLLSRLENLWKNNNINNCFHAEQEANDSLFSVCESYQQFG